MLRSACVSVGILVLSLSIAGCDDSPTTPTPTPAPAPAPAPAPTPTPTPTPPPEPAALASLTLNPPTVESQTRSEGTVTLTAAAPAGGAVVSLKSNNTDVAKVGSNVSVAAGATTAVFVIETSTVGFSTPVTMEASYSGVTKTAVLTVVPPTLVARFNVVSASRGSGACAIIDAAGSIDCQLDASSSQGFPAKYLWSLKVGSNSLAFSPTDNAFTPTTTCGFLGGAAVDSNGIVAMEISLQLQDRSDNMSKVEQKTVNLYPNSRCGY